MSGGTLTAYNAHSSGTNPVTSQNIKWYIKKNHDVTSTAPVTLHRPSTGES